MKVCRECGTIIIDGENGCMLAGDICFSCRPWHILPVPARNWLGSSTDYEGAILDRQEVGYDD